MSVEWLKTGSESQKMADAEKAVTEKRRAEQNKMFRFFLKKKGEGKVLFVDGDLGPQGYLTPPRFYEHFVNFNGDWVNIVCPQQTNPAADDKCPICEGRDRPSLVSLFTVIDLVPYTTKDGRVIPFTRKLLVAKPTTFELLNKLAVKRQGLVGAIFDVSRINDKAPAVGDVYDFTEKINVDEAKKKYIATFKAKDAKNGQEVQKTVCLFEPAKYTEEIIYRTGDQLRQMGFGAPGTSVPSGGSPDKVHPESLENVSDYKDQL